MTDMETLHKYYDAIRTGDPDRQVSDGVDIKAVGYALERIAELEAQNQRYREALEAIAGNDFEEWEMAGVAKQALDDKGDV